MNDHPSDDPMESVLRDRRSLQRRIDTLEAELIAAAKAMAIVQGELEARVREVDRLNMDMVDRFAQITRLQGYVFSLRARVKSFAEGAVAMHEEAMSDGIRAALEAVTKDPKVARQVVDKVTAEQAAAPVAAAQTATAPAPPEPTPEPPPAVPDRPAPVRSSDAVNLLPINELPR